jgi:hypothetical protein
MSYIIFTAIVIAIIFSAAKFKPHLSFFNSRRKFQNAELVKALLTLEEEPLNELFRLYKKEFGAGAATYARRTYQKWKAGEVRPSRQTFSRFLIYLPKVMSYDLKCQILRRLMEEYCSRNDYKITVFTDDWEETLTPLVTEIIDKPYTAQLPKPIEEKLRWLAEDEMQAAHSILKKSQVQESKIAVSMLRQEFENIEKLLENTKGKSKVTHKLKFPYGTITLKIKRR